MAKIKLGIQPKTIAYDLSFPMVNGSTGEVKLDYVYRDRKAFAEFVDAHIASIKLEAEAAIQHAKAQIKAAKTAADDDQVGESIMPTMSETEIATKQIDSQVKFIMGAVSGWDLEAPFDRESVEELVTTLPQAASAIIQSYRTVMTEGRLGN